MALPPRFAAAYRQSLQTQGPAAAACGRQAPAGPGDAEGGRGEAPAGEGFCEARALRVGRLGRGGLGSGTAHSQVCQGGVGSWPEDQGTASVREQDASVGPGAYG